MRRGTAAYAHRMELAEAAEEVYSLRPDEFIPRRDELAAEAKQAGDRALSTAVKKLPKPTAAAWVVNMLVRHDADQVEQVLQLGSALRAAQASLAGEDLRQLGRQRRQLTAAVTRQARALAAELGQNVGEPVAQQVEETLHAAMIDEDAAAAVRTGLLTKALTATGVESVDVLAVVAVPDAMGRAVVRRATERAPRPRAVKAAKPEPASPPELHVVPDNSRAVEEAEQDLARAEQVLAEEETRLAKAARKVEKREARALQLQAELEELRRRVADVEQRIEDNEDDLAEAEENRDERQAALDAAHEARDRAKQALADLQ